MRKSFLGIGLFILLFIGDFLLISVWAKAPKEAKIAFVSRRNDNYEIYIMDSDGGSPRNLTKTLLVNEEDPAWSPDGQKIAFTSGWDDEIYVMDSDGENRQRLTKAPDFDSNPAWSPGGRKIAFTSNRDGNEEIYVMDTDGGNLRRLTKNPETDSKSSWSPDGEKIVFTSFNHGSNIFVINFDGDHLRMLTNSGRDDTPSWSPDGKKIAFTSYRDGNYEIYVMDADGKNLRNLTCSPGIFDKDPDWFDPDFVHPYPVSSVGKLRTLWGWLRQNSLFTPSINKRGGQK